MGLNTPIDRHYKFGELFKIRGSYRTMSESIEMKNLEKKFFDFMISDIIESGNMEKIERFARKNRKLSDFTKENAINEAYAKAEANENFLNLPKVVKQSAKKKAEDAVSKKSISIKTNSYKIPSFTKTVSEPTIFESLEDYVENDSEKKEIDELIKNIGEKNGILGDSSNGKKDDDGAEDTDNTVTDSIKHNYSIQEVRMELTSTSNKTIDVFNVYSSTPSNEKTILNSNIKGVTDCINAICKINFSENDYIWVNSGRPEPFLRGEIIVTSDTIRGGSTVLNEFFGPTGKYKDYLYKPDGSPRVEIGKSSSMSDVEKDVNSINNYPIVKVYAVVYSWDNVNGRDTMRSISAEDFYGTNIKFVE